MPEQPGTVVTDTDVPVHRSGNLEVRTLVAGTHYAEPMTLRSLRTVDGEPAQVTDERHDGYLYVLGGEGRIAVGAQVHEVGEHDAVQVHAGECWSALDPGMWLLSFLVPAPVTPWARMLAKDTSRVEHVASLGQQVAQAATGDRQFEVLFGASRGSRGATMFVGFIPTSGAPEHYHLYDELCVIVRGSGTLHALDRSQPIGVGSAFHVAPRLLHALENPNADDLWILGVFRPEGSAAAAFYPDGTPAPTNEE